MNNTSHLLKFPIETNCFDPDEVRSLVVAFENACAAVPKKLISHTDIAARVVSIAIGGERDANEIYLKCLDELQRQGISIFPGTASALTAEGSLGTIINNPRLSIRVSSRFPYSC
jgi:hypothetical protein